MLSTRTLISHTFSTFFIWISIKITLYTLSSSTKNEPLYFTSVKYTLLLAHIWVWIPRTFFTDSISLNEYLGRKAFYALSIDVCFQIAAGFAGAISLLEDLVLKTSVSDASARGFNVKGADSASKAKAVIVKIWEVVSACHNRASCSGLVSMLTWFAGLTEIFSEEKQLLF